MPPDALPPDDAGRTEPDDGNVVDPAVLAERRAHRAELAERSAVRRAADAQSLAAELAGERARLEAERDAARAEAAAAREGADVAIAESVHVQAERDELRAALEQARAERDAIRAEMARARSERDAARAEAERAQGAAAPREGRAVVRNGNGTAPPVAWASGLRRELAVARTASARAEAAGSESSSSPLALVPPAPEPASPVPGLARERRIAARRAAEAPPVGPARGPQAPAEAHEQPVPVEAHEQPPAEARESQTETSASAPPREESSPRRDDRAAPVTALALERERSSRLQAQLEEAAIVQRELRERLAALDHAVHERLDAERRVEGALQRVREEFDAARRLAAAARAAEATAEVPEPTTPTPVPVVPLAPSAPAAASVPLASPPAASAPPARAATETPSQTGVDALRLTAAQARLRAVVPPPVQQHSAPPPSGPPTRWLPDALRRLAREQPETAGRILVGMLPAQHLVARRPFAYDLVLAGRGAIGVDVGTDATMVRPRALARPRREVDLRIATDEAGLARLVYGRRGLRRRARVRGSHRRVRELRRLANAPLALRDLARTRATLDPALAFWLAALAIDPADTFGSRFTIAHAPLAGGPGDAWLRIHDGDPLAVLRAQPADAPVATLRCTRGALLPLLAGVEPPPGEIGTIDGDPNALALLRSWIAHTEFATA